MSMGPHPVVENHPQMPSCLLSLRACHWLSHCSKSQEMCPSDGTLLATSTPVRVNVRRTIGASCFLYPKECSLECTLFMALSRYRDALVQWVGPERPLVYQPLVPRILTACYQVVLLPPRDFGELPPVARDIYYAVALFLQVRAAHPDLIQKHRGPGSLLLTPRLDTQATFAKLFADIGIDGDVRYARVDDLLRHGPPAPASITARHVQALRADLRAETLSHAAGLTSHTTLLVFGKSGFIGTDEAGHGRSTVGLTRARGTTILLGLPDPYGLTGLVQTTYAYYFSVHTAYWQLPDAPLPLSLGSQDVVDALRPLDATSWAEVPLALQIHTPQGRTVLLRLTLKRRKLPHPSFDPESALPIFPRATGPEANHCYWGYCGSRTNRTLGWYGTIEDLPHHTQDSTPTPAFWQ